MSGLIVGRDGELATIGERLTASPQGLQVLLIEGEPGIGKTTVWQAGIEHATGLGFRILPCRAAQAETRLSFAGLGDLMADVGSDAFQPLPPPQCQALERALLRAEAGPVPPPPLAIGAAVVGVVAGLSEHGPVLVGIDDLQWLDKSTVSALAFAFRRLEDRAVTVFATVRTRDPNGRAALFDRLPPERVRHIRLGPLSLGAMYEVLRPRLGSGLTRPLIGSIETASRGNPFYALELARAIQDAKPGAGGVLPVPDDTNELLARRLRRLPRHTREELLRASALAHPTELTIDMERLQPAVDAEIARVDRDGRVEFSHPLFAAAVYAAASVDARRRVHRELATAATDVEEQARHLSLANDGPDPELADLLDRASEHALSRGAPEIAAEMAELAARRTSADQRDLQSERLLRAARHCLKAGDPTRARALAEEVSDATPTGPIRARALDVLAESRAMDGPSASIPLLEEAIRYAGDDDALAAELELSLGYMLQSAFQLLAADGHVARAVELAGRLGDRELLAQAVAFRELLNLLLGRGVDEDELERALDLDDPDQEVTFQRRPTLIVALVAEYLGRLDRAQALLTSLDEQLVARGDEGDRAQVLIHRGVCAMHRGELKLAEQRADDALRVATIAGQELMCAFALALRGLVRTSRGDIPAARIDGEEALERSERMGWLIGVNQSRYVLAWLSLSEGDPKAAATWLEPMLPLVEGHGVFEWPFAFGIPDAIEALISTGDLTRAQRLTDKLETLGRQNDRPWALALSGRSRALLAAAAGDLDEARARAEQALIDHERLPMPIELGRTLLVLGQIRRRRGERRAARETLRRAEAIFDEIGARLWADKSRAEARRIGVRHAPTELTSNEQTAAQLAADGLTNREIAARLFMSRRTVEANLSRAYGKLGVRSRTELAGRMASHGMGDGSE